jgi:hypothetical protein
MTIDIETIIVSLYKIYHKKYKDKHSVYLNISKIPLYHINKDMKMSKL